MRLHTLLIILAMALIQSCERRQGNAGTGDLASILLSSRGNKASCVYLTTNEHVLPVISWCEVDATKNIHFFFSTFDSTKGTFVNTTAIPIEQNVALHEEGMPKIAIKGDGTIIAIYETTSPTRENQWAGDVRYIQSSDQGKTWTAPANIYGGSSAGESHSFATITRLTNGEIGVSWLDHPPSYQKHGRPVKFASTLHQQGFSAAVTVDSLACECCRLAIAAGDSNKISIVYRDILNDTVRDISIASSLNSGRTFGSGVSFSRDNWNINGCPHNGPDLVGDAKANYAVWFTGGQAPGIYYGELDAGNNIVLKNKIAAEGKNVQVSIFPNGTRVIAYSETLRNNDSVYNRIAVKKLAHDTFYKKDITSLRARAAYPVIKTFTNNKIAIAWTEAHQVFYTILDDADINEEVLEPGAVLQKSSLH